MSGNPDLLARFRSPAALSLGAEAAKRDDLKNLVIGLHFTAPR
jgi:hypothetical protein